MQEIIVDLHINRDEWLRLYRGESQRVSARSRDGRSVQFPANILSPFTSHDGIHGSFVIAFNKEGKFQGVTRIA